MEQLTKHDLEDIIAAIGEYMERLEHLQAVAEVLDVEDVIEDRRETFLNLKSKIQKMLEGVQSSTGK